jgi:hypothetical protein
VMPSLAEEGPAKFWTDRWHLRETGWQAFEHGQSPDHSAALFRHNLTEIFNLAGATKVEGGRLRVLIPLCGDTPAFHYFTTGLLEDFYAGDDSLTGVDVVGVDLAPDALKSVRQSAGFSSCQWEGKRETTSVTGTLYNSYVTVVSGPGSKRSTVTLYEGDFFAVVAEVLAPAIAEGKDRPFQLLYDRAAFVAILPNLREKYVNSMLAVLAPAAPVGAMGFLPPCVMLEIVHRPTPATPLGKPIGPPFHVEPADIDGKHYTREHGFSAARRLPAAAVDTAFLASDRAPKVPFLFQAFGLVRRPAE